VRDGARVSKAVCANCRECRCLGFRFGNSDDSRSRKFEKQQLVGRGRRRVR